MKQANEDYQEGRLRYNLLLCKHSECKRLSKPKITIKINSSKSSQDSLTIERECINCLLDKGLAGYLLALDD